MPPYEWVRSLHFGRDDSSQRSTLALGGFVFANKFGRRSAGSRGLQKLAKIAKGLKQMLADLIAIHALILILIAEIE